MSNWLSRIQDPRDIRGLSVDQLKEIAEEIRDTLLRVTAINGGHLASSLGAVEITLALHYVLNTPDDKIIFDVGHQAYAHKLLTGRAAQFDSLRTEGGISGFLQRAESPYDAFGAGHASTSISAAVGMAMARDRLGKSFRVASVTGDGAMTGGICYEALNNAGSLGTDLLVVLNDNEMSISANVGALSRYFNRIVTTNFYSQRRQQAMDLVKKLPAGHRLLGMANRVEESVKGLIVPGIFFEELGFRYLGPFDGHNLSELIPVLQKVRSLKGPILLHVITRKGKGRAYSEADPVTWHSPPLNFDAESGEAPPKTPGPPSYTKIFSQSLCAEARRDSRLVAVTAAMLEGTGLARFKDEFPERTYDVGIAEEHAVIAAAGMACEGLRPVVCIYSSFMQRAYDQIIHDVALQNLPVIFSLDRGGLVGSDGPTHHGVFDLSYLRMIPNMVVMAPMDGDELRDMTHTAAVYEDGPIAIRFPRGSAPRDVNTGRDPLQLEIGRGETIREGDDICIVGIGTIVGHALDAARLLDADGISCAVINARFVKPLDRELICAAARRYGRLVTIEDNVIAGGFGSAILELLSAENIDARVVTLGLPDKFIEHGKQSSLFEKYGLSAQGIADCVRAEMKIPRDPAVTRD